MGPTKFEEFEPLNESVPLPSFITPSQSRAIMAESSGEATDVGVMKITVKTPKEKHTVEVKIGGSVREVCYLKI